MQKKVTNKLTTNDVHLSFYLIRFVRLDAAARAVALQLQYARRGGGDAGGAGATCDASRRLSLLVDRVGEISPKNEWLRRLGKIGGNFPRGKKILLSATLRLTRGPLFRGTWVD